MGKTILFDSDYKFSLFGFIAKRLGMLLFGKCGGDSSITRE
jgi:hypothetical protein